MACRKTAAEATAKLEIVVEEVIHVDLQGDERGRRTRSGCAARAENSDEMTRETGAKGAFRRVCYEQQMRRIRR
jgi:hypothetical protein